MYNEENLYSVISLVVLHILNFQLEHVISSIWINRMTTRFGDR